MLLRALLLFLFFAFLARAVWRLIEEAVDVYVKQLSETERKLLSSVRQRRAAATGRN